MQNFISLILKSYEPTRTVFEHGLSNRNFKQPQREKLERRTQPSNNRNYRTTKIIEQPQLYMFFLKKTSVFLFHIFRIIIFQGFSFFFNARVTFIAAAGFGRFTFLIFCLFAFILLAFFLLDFFFRHRINHRLFFSL